ncbi:MAG: hypothetical protein ACLR1I_11365 [Ruminococcus sp.]
MRRADKEFLNAQIENLKESAHERFATVLMQVDYLNLKLLKAEKGCKKLREENRRLRAENQMLEDNCDSLMVNYMQESEYSKKIYDDLQRANIKNEELERIKTILLEQNSIMAGKLSVYEPIKKAESQPDETADTVRESDPAEK